MRRSIVLFAVPFTLAVAAACSSSSSNSNNNGTPEAGPTGPVVVCGSLTCPSTDVCCFNSTSPTCQPAGGCIGGSFIGCSSNANCSNNQTCCFTYENDAGSTSGPYNAQCVDSCPSTSYQLCVKDSDCPTGDTCINPGALGHAPYCGTGGGLASLFGDGGFGSFDGNFSGYFDGNFGGLFDGNFGLPPATPEASTTTPEASTTATDAAGTGD